MIPIHSQWKRIPESEIGDMSHVEYQNYIRWMREMTQAHFAVMGFNRDYFRALEKTFVVRRHSVEHLSPCFAGDRLLLVTWLSEAGARAIKRQHRIYKVDDTGEQSLVLAAENLAVFVDKAVKPATIPADLVERLVPSERSDVERFIKQIDDADPCVE